MNYYSGLIYSPISIHSLVSIKTFMSTGAQSFCPFAAFLVPLNLYHVHQAHIVVVYVNLLSLKQFIMIDFITLSCALSPFCYLILFPVVVVGDVLLKVYSFTN